MNMKPWLTFAAGGMAGLMLAVCMGIHTGRPGTVGGEVLIIPLMVLLIYVGWQAGQLEAAARPRKGRRHNEKEIH